MGETAVDYLLRIAEVEKQSGMARSTIYKRMADGTFPEPVKLSSRQVRWRQSDVTRWREGLERASFAKPLPCPIVASASGEAAYGAAG